MTGATTVVFPGLSLHTHKREWWCGVRCHATQMLVLRVPLVLECSWPNQFVFLNHIHLFKKGKFTYQLGKISRTFAGGFMRSDSLYINLQPHEVLLSIVQTGQRDPCHQRSRQRLPLGRREGMLIGSVHRVTFVRTACFFLISLVQLDGYIYQ